MDPILFVSDLIARLGYPGVAIAMFIETFFPPMPSEIVLPFAGFAAARGDLTLVGVMVAATLGSLAGAAGLYAFGRLVSDAQLQRIVEKYGKAFGIRHKDVLAAKKWFANHGHTAVFFGRMIPGVRTVISVPAGINRMPFIPFMLWSGFGTAVWSIVLCVAGYYLGNRYELVAHVVGPFAKVVAVILLIGVVVGGMWIVKRNRKSAS